MSNSYRDPLSLPQRVLRLLIALNLSVGALILVLLIASLINEPWVIRALGAGPSPGSSMLIMAMRLIMVLGICAAPIVHVVLTRLLTIVESVSVGNPFIVANAQRLETIAWAILGLELMHVAVGMIATAISPAVGEMHIDWSFSLTRWLAVLMLFVLARVFEQGARMREDLEGTI